MKHVIEIEAPKGKIPVYDAKSGKITFKDENVMERVKSYEDALEVLGEVVPTYFLSLPKHLQYRIQMETIIRALNRGYQFKLTEGWVYYPYIKFYLEDKLPSEYKEKKLLTVKYCGNKYKVVGGSAFNGSDAGVGSFDSYYGVGYSWFYDQSLACKSEEIAKYVSSQFSELLFNMHYYQHLDYSITKE